MGILRIRFVVGHSIVCPVKAVERPVIAAHPQDTVFIFIDGIRNRYVAVSICWGSVMSKLYSPQIKFVDSPAIGSKPKYTSTVFIDEILYCHQTKYKDWLGLSGNE